MTRDLFYPLAIHLWCWQDVLTVRPCPMNVWHRDGADTPSRAGVSCTLPLK